MRYLIGFLVTIGLIVLIIVLLLTGGSKKGAAPKTLHIDDYATSATADAVYTVDGPIVANQEHYSLKIGVSQNQVEATMYQGYDQAPLRTQTYPNNPQSFAVFMHALNLAGYSVGNADKSLQDERGHCPAGERMIYQLTDDNKSLMRFWRTSCGEGTFKGNMANVSYLFRHQIPDEDFSALIQDTNVSF